jgi:glycerophosphoryl diester phosphodiesterase
MLRSVSNSPILRENGIPIIVGHRGFFTVLENSLKAFQTAADKGLRMVELDIWLSKDNVPVVIHCNEEGCVSSNVIDKKGLVNDFTWEELRQFNIGKDQTLPSLKQVFDICSDKVFINIEIKEKVHKEKIVKECLSLISEYKISDQVLFSSFDHSYYNIVRSNTSIEFKFLMHNREEYDKFLKLDKTNLTNASVCINNNLLSKEDVEYFHRNKLPVSVYFEKSEDSFNEEKLNYLYDIDVDHLIVDDPLFAIDHKKRHFEKKTNLI